MNEFADSDASKNKALKKHDSQYELLSTIMPTAGDSYT